MRVNNTVSAILAALTVSVALALASSSPAAASEGHGWAFGEPGKASQVTRTIMITMRDTSYEPKSVMVRPGETIRFVLKNTGQLLHEFNLGTQEMHAKHQKEMEEMLNSGAITATGINHAAMNSHTNMASMDHSKMDMSKPMRHDDPNAVLVEPGKTAELIWKFTKAAEVEFACNIPGHVQAGMIGRIRFM